MGTGSGAMWSIASTLIKPLIKIPLKLSTAHLAPSTVDRYRDPHMQCSHTPWNLSVDYTLSGVNVHGPDRTSSITIGLHVKLMPPLSDIC